MDVFPYFPYNHLVFDGPLPEPAEARWKFDEVSVNADIVEPVVILGIGVLPEVEVQELVLVVVRVASDGASWRPTWAVAPQVFAPDATATLGKPSLMISNTISLNPAPAGFGLKFRHCM
jgi:hypothetical protein